MEGQATKTSAVDGKADAAVAEPGTSSRGSQSLADRLFLTLRSEIVEGRIAAGSKISEPELARRFDASRGSLREALMRLESLSLIERRVNVGARVVDLTERGLLEIYDVREALEGMACRLAAQNRSEEDLVELRQMLERHEQQEELQKGTAYFQPEGDFDFHFRIVQAAHNDLLIDTLCNKLYYRVRMYRYQLGMASPRAHRAFREHSHIIEAIEAGDGELAEILMRRHIRASRSNIENKLSKQN
ncbi:GntR family transcriptional regulator [Microbulbifer hydrolyticus]|uniref:DNA-binding GntR family transcriptional regulator n=1 Tax=Microbulbifer hydrolyticus TaxID=48074 RepID=A0A6P1T883_9GAMM|nr:GntR family transcriptional regulator [Microbulbifer hydrolyticus]MBB5210535.1 DNA-binding GntR family transcriptional regulator [Microbulbifer hydrolyticus]QHQ38994.1 FCD domain-containing protein [Microbulbifer hydrolyticus]